jgi:hypothetical protein
MGTVKQLWNQTEAMAAPHCDVLSLNTGKWFKWEMSCHRYLTITKKFLRIAFTLYKAH